jgi:hypothetical protein
MVCASGFPARSGSQAAGAPAAWDRLEADGGRAGTVGRGVPEAVLAHCLTGHGPRNCRMWFFKFGPRDFVGDNVPGMAQLAALEAGRLYPSWNRPNRIRSVRPRGRPIGSAVCRDAPNSAVPSAEQMVNLATASGHTNLYGATRSGGAGRRRTGSPSAPSTDYRRFAVVLDGLVYFQAASGDVRCLYVPRGMTSVLGCAAKDLGQRVVVLSAARVQRAVERVADLHRGEMPVGSATFGQSALGSLFSCSNSRRALTCRVPSDRASSRPATQSAPCHRARSTGIGLSESTAGACRPELDNSTWRRVAPGHLGSRVRCRHGFGSKTYGCGSRVPGGSQAEW